MTEHQTVKCNTELDEEIKNIALSCWQVLSRELAEKESSSPESVEQILDELVAELEMDTDEVFQKIIDYCHQHELPIPDLGYELMNEAGEVTVDMLELAWPEQRVGVYDSGVFNVDAYQMTGWVLFSSEVTQDLDKLVEVLS